MFMLRSCAPWLLLAGLGSNALAQDCDIGGLVQIVGQGTSGSSGVLRLVNVGPPLAGQSLGFELRDGPSAGAGVVYAGFAPAVVPVPELAGVGYVAPPFLVEPVIFDAQGVSTQAFAFPSVPDYCGVQTYLQGVALDGAAQGGIALSNGLRIRFGGRPGSAVFTQPLVKLKDSSWIVESADLNGDGLADAVLGGWVSGLLSILLGDGKGTLLPAKELVYSSLPPDSEIQAAAIHDLNGDGVQDIVAIASTSPFGSPGILLVSLGIGGGLFAPEQNYAVNGSPRALAVGDLDGDGNLDACVSDSLGNLSILMGLGGGGFGTPAMLSVTGMSIGLDLADLELDGALDLVIRRSAYDDAWILPGLGDGSFGPGYSVTLCGSSASPSAIAVGDMDQDGVPDLVASIDESSGPDSVSVILGLGGGAFAPPVSYAAPISSVLEVSDLDMDGVPDVILRGSTLPGQGDGSLGPAMDYLPYELGSQQRFAVADFNGDRVPDILWANWNSVIERGAASVLFGRGRAEYATALHYDIGERPVDAVTGDFDGDGRTDLAVLPDSGAGVRLLSVRSDGQLESADFVPLEIGSRTDLARGDLDGNGRDDIIVVNALKSQVQVVLATGAGEWATPVAYPVRDQPEAVVVVDLDADGHLDLAVVSPRANGITLLFGAGDGTFSPAPPMLMSGGRPTSIDAGDLNGDGLMDLVVANVDAGTVSAFQSNGSGAFAPAQESFAGIAPRSVELGDFNGDGVLDCAVVNPAALQVSILMGSGTGGFAAPLVHPLPDRPDRLTTGDFDGDGRLDVAVTLRDEVGSSPVQGTLAYVGILLGRGDGTLERPSFYASSLHTTNLLKGTGELFLASGDLTGDGMPDLFTEDVALGQLSVLQNQIIALSGVDDCNGNGVPDWIDINSGSSLDSDGDGVPDECSADCNGNGIPDHRELSAGWVQDCNGNGVSDECDLAFGFSQDCDGNGVPDECEYTEDCNGNGIPDGCELFSGSSLDTDGDGILDECEAVFFFEDFESSNGAWEFWLPESSHWHVATDGECGAVTQMAAFNRGPIACDFGHGAETPGGTLLSAPFKMGLHGPFSLSLTSRLDLAIPGTAYVRLVLEGLEDGGPTFVLGNTLFEKVFSDDGQFEELTFDIPDTEQWAGIEARFRFEFLGLPGFVQGAGWQVDNVELRQP